MPDKDMHIIADFSIIPLGVGLSLSKYVAAIEKELKKFKLKTKLHAMGTNLEGEWDEVMKAVKACHEVLYRSGVTRITSTLKISSRNDKAQSIENKIGSVESKL